MILVQYMTKSSITELTSNNKKNKVVIHLSSSTKLGHFRASSLILFALSCVSSDCFGELMEDLTVLSPKAIAMANAVTADPPGIDSIHFNPAGLMQFEGDTLELKLATFDLKNRYSTGPQQVDPTVKASYENLTQSPYPQDPYANQQGATSEPVLLIPGGSTETVPFPIVPLGGAATRNAQHQMVFASAVYSPMMVGFSRPDDDLGRYQGNETAISRITYFSPSFGFQVGDSLALGLGINFSYQGLALRMENRAPQASAAILGGLLSGVSGQQIGPGPYDDVATLNIAAEDYLSVGFNLGLLWSPLPWFTLGLAYRSAAKSNLEGDFSMRYSHSMQELSTELRPIFPKMEGVEFERGEVKMEFTTPQHMSLGTSIMVTTKFKLNVDVQKSFYSEWDKFTFDFDQPLDYLVFASLLDSDGQDESLTLQRNYKNALSWSIAAEYQWDKSLLLRAGYQRRNSNIPGNALDLIIPISDADFYGVGFAYSTSEDSHIDLGLGYLVSRYNIDYGQSNNANSDAPLDLIYNPYAYLPIRASTRAFLLSVSYRKPF